MSRIDELKARLRTAPQIEATFATIDAQFAKLQTDYVAVKTRRDELAGQVAQFACDRAELGLPEPAAAEIKTGESAPDPSQTAKPTKQGNKK